MKILSIDEHNKYIKEKKENYSGIESLENRKFTIKNNLPLNTSSRNPLNMSAKDKEKIYKKNEKEMFKQSNILRNKYENAGVILNKNGILPTTDSKTYMQNSTPKYLTQDYKTLSSDEQKHKIVNLSMKANENTNKFKSLQKQEDFKKQTKAVEEAYDKTALSYYDYLLKKVDEDEIGIYDKTIGMAVEGIKAPLSFGKYSLKNENGESYMLPTYGALKQQKVMNSYKTGVGKLAGGALYELGRQGTSFALNALVPGAGTTTYFGNMYLNNWNNAVKEGYDSDKALVYATLGTGLEYYTGKFLGGTTNMVFGTGSSELSKSIGRGLSKVITNHPRLVNALSNGIAEGGEEFIQVYLDKINRNLALQANEKIFTKETFEDAIYSATVGVITGEVNGAISSDMSYATKQNSLNSQISEAQNNIAKLEEQRNNNLADIKKINKIDNKIATNYNNINRLKNELNYQNVNTQDQINNIKKERGTGNNTAASSFSDNNISQNSDKINLPIDTSINNMKSKQINTINNALSQEITYKTIEANKSKENVEMANINDILPLKKSGGYRTNEQINILENNIRKNGINTPIELIKKADGSIEIANGNHRLEIAQKLGLKQVPIKFVEDYVANASQNSYNNRQENLDFIKGDSDGSFKRASGIKENNDSKQSIIRSSIRDSVLSNEGRPIRGNDTIYPPLVGHNNRPSSSTTRTENSTQGVGRTTEEAQGLDNSSFNNAKNDNKIPTAKDINKVNLPIAKDSNQVNTKENIDSNIKLPLAREVRKTDIENKISKHLQNRKYKLAGESTKAAQRFINFDRYEKQSFKGDLAKYSGMSKNELQTAKTYQEIKNIVEKYADREVNYIDEELASIKNVIRNYKIKIDDYIKSNMNYNEFRKQNFGKLRLGNEGIGVDSAWQELSELYPQYFNKNIVNEFDMLESLSDFMNQSSKITENYRLSDFEIISATNRVLDKLINNSLTEEEISELQTYLEDKYSARTRTMVQQELLEEMNIKIEDLDVGKDIGSIAYQRTDPIRLNEKVFGAKIGKKINDATINQTKHNEAERIRFLNQERSEIENLGIKAQSKESAAVQKYAEKSYLDEHGEKISYGDAELKAEFPNVNTQEKIKNAAKVLRSKYDTYIDSINDVITSLGYDAIPKRKDYMRHFQELDNKFSKWGLPLSNINDENIPTDINGLTDQFKPGKNWFASAMERKGLKTTYDAITGIDGYLEGASNLIYHTKDIQRYRSLSKLIRDTYGQTHGMDNMNKFTSEQFNQRLDDIYNGKLSKYVAWLDEQANSLAGKKGAIDRVAERVLGRKVYTVLDTAKKQVGSNMVGFNVRSALTNFASAVQGASKTNKIAFLKGTISTFKNIIRNDGMVDKSDFLTARFGSSQLSTKLWQKMSNAGQILMTGSDYFTSNQIWRSKYFENIQKGMSEKQAIKSADSFSARIMGDRSKGSTAEIFNSKTLGLFTQFQLEVNNQWSSMIHDNKIDIENGNKTKASVLFQVGQLAAASYLFNNLMKSLTGSGVMFDPIDMFKKLLGLDDEDEDKELDERAFEVLGDLVNNIPMASIFTGGRIPISEAFTGGGTFLKKISNQKDKYGNDITWGDVGKDVASSAAYWLLPTGYGQIKKSVKGSSMYNKNLPIAGSYTNSGNLRFNADESTGGKIKAVLFGQYSSEEAQKYIDSGYKSIDKTHIQEMKNLKMNSSEYRKYRAGLAEAGKKNIDKVNYVNGLNIDNNKKNIMLSNILFDETNTDKLESINNLNMSDNNKNKYFTALANANSINADKNIEDKKKKISEIILNTELSDKNIAHLYSNYYSDEETLNNLIAMKIPIKEFIKLNSECITGDYNTRTGKTISGSKKNKVINYVNSLNLSIPQKAILIKSQYNTYNSYNNQIVNYVNNLNKTANEKKVLLKSIGFDNYSKDVFNYINSQKITKEEKEKKLKSLGFTIREGMVYW